MELKDLPRERLLALLDAYSRQALATDGFWFLAVEDKYGYPAAFELDHAVWEKLAAMEAKRTVQALGIKKQTVEAALEALALSPMALTLGPRIDVESEWKGTIRFEDCRIQKNRIKAAREPFLCKPMGVLWLKGFVTTINPAIKVRCEYCHPEPHPEDIWCKWVLEM